MSGKVKTSIVIDRELWEKFKAKVGVEKGLRKLSEAVEDIIREYLSDILIARTLEAKLLGKRLPSIIKPIKPKVKTDAGVVLRELRESRI